MPRQLFSSPASAIAIGGSALAGIFVAFLMRINATLGEHIGVLEATFVVHAVGTVFALLLIGTRLTKNFWRELRRGPAHELSGGVIGVLIVLLGNIVVPPLGVALALSLFVAADIFFSTVSDHFGWLGLPQVKVTGRRMIGLMFVLVGVLLLRWG